MAGKVADVTAVLLMLVRKMSYLKTKRIRYRRHFGPGCSRNKEKNKESESVNQKEFYWDKIVKTTGIIDAGA